MLVDGSYLCSNNNEASKEASSNQDRATFFLERMAFDEKALAAEGNSGIVVGSSK